MNTYLDRYFVKGSFDFRFLIIIILALVVLLSFRTCTNAVSDTVGSWFGSKTKTELVVENAALKTIAKDVIQVNETIIFEQKVERQTAVAVDKIFVESKKKAQKTTFDSDTRIKAFEQAVQAVEATVQLSESQKSTQVAQLSIDSLWASYCSASETNKCN